jgi:hypothetical protein
MSALQNAIQHLRQGNPARAQELLEPIVRADLHNIQAWLWYAQTWQSREARTQVLKACLTVNPGDQQILQALEQLSRQPAPPVTPSPAGARAKIAPVRAPETHLAERIFTLIREEAQATPSQPNPTSALPELEKTSPAVDHDRGSERAAVARILLENPEDQPDLEGPKPFYRVWFTALTRQNVHVYAHLLEAPEAGVSRALEWQIYSQFVLLTVGAGVEFLQIPIFPESTGRQALRLAASIFAGFASEVDRVWFFAALILIGTLLSALALLLTGAVQNLLALLLGGEGDFSRTVYALSAYGVPLTLLAALLSFLPQTAPLLLVIGVYALALNLRALRAAHALSGLRAVLAVILLPGLVLCLLFGGSLLLWPGWADGLFPFSRYLPLR